MNFPAKRTTMDHREASLLLVDYVRGGISADQRRAVADHVAAHPECADTVRFLADLDADLQRHGRKLLGEHPAADALVAHAAGAPDELEPAEREAVAAHVSGCAACFADLQTVRRVHAELVEAPEAAAAGGRRGRGWTTVGMSLAAGLLLGVAIPRLLAPTTQMEIWEGPVPVVRVDGNRRDDSLPAFRVPAAAQVVPFVVAWDPWLLPGAAEGTPLLIRIEDTATGREAWRLATTIGEAWDAPNRVIAFLAPVAALGTGAKTLTITGPGGGAGFNSRLSLTLR
jgi:hypothetical protein